MTLLLTLKILSSVEISFWKASSGITFINRGCALFELLWLRFTVILLMILKLMILLTLARVTRKYFFLVTILLTFHSIYGTVWKQISVISNIRLFL